MRNETRCKHCGEVIIRGNSSTPWTHLYVTAAHTAEPAVETVPEGTKGRYKADGEFARTRLAGQVRIVGPIDPEGGAEMLSEAGEVMDYRTESGLTPERFWRDFEPVADTSLNDERRAPDARKQRTALAAVIKDARETFYAGTTNWGLPYDTFVAERVQAYLEKQS